MKNRRNRLIFSITIGIAISFLFVYYIGNFSTYFNCINCNFKAYQNGWISDYYNDLPKWDGMAPIPEGDLPIEEVEQIFYMRLSLKILIVGSISTLLTLLFINRIYRKFSENVSRK